MRVAPTEDAEEIATSPWRSALLLAGAAVLAVRFGLTLATLVMIVALVLMIFMHELGHYLTARWAGMKVTEFFIGFGPRIWSFHRGETEYGLKAIPAGAYVRIIGMSNLDEVDPSDEQRTYRSKPFARRLSVAVAGSTMHFLMAFALIYTVHVAFGLQDVDTPRWTVDSIVEPSAASSVGIKLGDRIVSVDGRDFHTFTAVSDYMRAHPGAHVTLGVLRDGRILTKEATLARTNPKTGEKVGFLGVGPAFPAERLGPLHGLVQSAKDIGAMSKASVLGLAHIVSPKGVTHYVDTLVSPDANTKAGIPDEGRPTSVVGVVRAGSEIAHEGWVNVLYLLFGVNVYIGLFNMIPMLPFDGGHVAIATYEKIRSRAMGREYRADVAKVLPFTYAIVLALVLLFVTSLYLDIVHPVSIR
jgi:membrane-associated protease RseP (regulator of RpoE activity)